MSSFRTTVDEADVGRFEQIGEDWWNPRGSMRMLHKFNPLRVEWLTRSIADRLESSVAAPERSSPLQGYKILDIGCGGGILSESLSRRGACVTAIDPAAGNIDIARRHAEQSRLSIDYQAVTAEALAQTPAQFDVVCAMEVIEHVTDMPAFMKTAASLVRPGGLLFAATLNRTFKSFALAVVGAEYVLGWIPKGTHQWEKFVTPQELEEAMENAGVEPVERTGVAYEPLRDRWLESRDMSINYMMAGVRMK